MGAVALFLAAACSAPPPVQKNPDHFFVRPSEDPRAVLEAACRRDWCPLLKPAIAAEVGCPPPVLEQPERGYLWPDYAADGGL